MLLVVNVIIIFEGTILGSETDTLRTTFRSAQVEEPDQPPVPRNRRRRKKRSNDEFSDTLVVQAQIPEMASPNGETCLHGRLSQEQSRLIHLDLNNFQRLRIIGRGDVGTVYLVRDLTTRQLFALKVMSKEEMIKRGKIQRALTEREILATAASPFILNYHGSAQDDERLYLLLDWASGGEFFRLAQRLPDRRFPEAIVRFYSAEVLMALEYLHQIGVVYRDLKPENILLGSNGHVLLADFDLSKTLPVQPRKVHVTPRHRINFSFRHGIMRERSFDAMSCGNDAFQATTNSFVGTAEYLAPEVIRGTGQTGSVDFWCLGVLIYEWLTGQSPFGTASSPEERQELFNTICDAKLRWPDDLTISREAKSLVKKLLRPDPSQRLGAEHGAADVRHHPFYRDVNFKKLAKMVPPLRPAQIDPETIEADPLLQGPWSDCLHEGSTPGQHRSTGRTTPVPQGVDHFAAFGVNASQVESSSTEASSGELKSIEESSSLSAPES